MVSQECILGMLLVAKSDFICLEKNLTRQKIQIEKTVAGNGD